MPSSYSASLRFELQYTGENTNTWGEKLNSAFERVDSAIAGLSTIALTANYSLTSANGTADQARSAILKFTGTGSYTVTVPSVSKRYTIWNATTGTLTVTTGAGSTVAIDTGDIVEVFCDASSVKTLGYGGLSLKDHIAAAALSATGSLPAVTGNAGKFVYTDGATSYWKAVSTADLGDYDDLILGVQVALATAL